MTHVYVTTDNTAGEGGNVIGVHATLEAAKAEREGTWVDAGGTDAGPDSWSLDYDTHDYYLIEKFQVAS